jgi:hypothetical protein
LPADRFTVLTSIAPDMNGHDAHERFESGLDILITGHQPVIDRLVTGRSHHRPAIRAARSRLCCAPPRPPESGATS